MKVLFISRYYYWWSKPNAGILNFVEPVRGLLARGHDVRFLCQRRPGQEIDEDGIPVHSFSLPAWLDIEQIYSPSAWVGRRLLAPVLIRVAFFLYIARILAVGIRMYGRWRPDVVYVFCEEPAIAGWLLAKISRAALVTHLLGGVYNEALIKSRWWRLKRLPDIVAAYYCRADAYFIEDDGTGCDRVAEYFGIPREKVHLWAIPIEQPKGVSGFRERHGIPADVPLVLAAARMVSVKRMDLAANVMASVLDQNTRAHAVLVGDGPERESIHDMVEGLSLAVKSRIHMTGTITRDELSSAYRESDVFITLQEMSVSGTNLRDALVHGSAVVAVRRREDRAVGGLIEHEVNGILIPEDRLEEFPLAVLELLADKPKRICLSEAARQRANREYETWEKRIARQEQILANLTAKRRIRSRTIGNESSSSN